MRHQASGQRLRKAQPTRRRQVNRLDANSPSRPRHWSYRKYLLRARPQRITFYLRPIPELILRWSSFTNRPLSQKLRPHGLLALPAPGIHWPHHRQKLPSATPHAMFLPPNSLARRCRMKPANANGSSRSSLALPSLQPEEAGMCGTRSIAFRSPCSHARPRHPSSCLEHHPAPASQALSPARQPKRKRQRPKKHRYHQCCPHPSSPSPRPEPRYCPGREPNERSPNASYLQKT